MSINEIPLEEHQVVTKEEWLIARKAHLEKEKQMTKMRDELLRERRALPWVKVEKEYEFHSSAGKVWLSDLFDGRSQLIVYHFMFGPEWKEGCPGCSFISDHFDAVNLHIPHNDVTLVAVSRAPLAKLEEFKKRMGWKFTWVSSFESDFNYDYHVSFTPEEIQRGEVFYNFQMTKGALDELHGESVFYRNPKGEIFHTYSSYARAGDILIGAHNFLDLTPRGRNETSTMSWMKHHDKYEEKAKPKDSCCGCS